MKLRFSLVSFSFGLHQQMPFLKLYYRWCLLFASPLQDKWNRSFCQDLKEIRMNDFQRKITYNSFKNLNSHWYDSKEINQISFQIRNAKGQFWVESQDFSCQLNNWKMINLCSIVFFFFKSAMHYYMYREIFSQLNRGRLAGINICSVNTQCATVGFVTRSMLEGGKRGLSVL